EGLDLADSEDGESLASIRAAEIISDQKSHTIVLSQPDVNAARAGWLWTLIGSRLRHRADQGPLRLAAGELTLRFRGGAATLIDSSAHVDTNSERNTLT